MTNKFHQRGQAVPPQANETWHDLKQYAWAVTSVLPFIAAAAYGARVIVGDRAALWLGIGIFAFVVAAYGLVVAACLAVSVSVDVLRRWVSDRQNRLGTFWISVLLAAVLGCRADQPSDAARDVPAVKRAIIDMHVHAMTFESFGAPVNGGPPPNPMTGKPSQAKTDADILRLTLDAMDRFNIKLAVLNGRLETVYAWKAKAPDRFLASAQFSGRPASDRTAHDPTPSLDSLRREHAAGRLQALGEITSPYEGIDYDGPELAPYFALATELKMPVGVHTGLTFPGGVYTCCPRYRVERGNPAHLDEVLARNPGLRLYLMHMGEMWHESTLAILHMYPQVYIDVATMDWGAMPREQFYATLRDLITAGFGKRIMFGSDAMVWPELIGQAIETIESAPFLSDEQKHDIFYNNAARFLGLPELPVPAIPRAKQHEGSVTR